MMIADPSKMAESGEASSITAASGAPCPWREAGPPDAWSGDAAVSWSGEAVAWRSAAAVACSGEAAVA